jgi:inorganic triphosphatase YgiF
MQLGHAARRAGRTTEALGHYRSAVEQDPESAEAQSYSRRAIGKNRSDVSAFKSLVQSTSGRLSSEELSALESRSGRAEQYGARLKPLRDGLSEAGVNLETGAWRGNS